MTGSKLTLSAVFILGLAFGQTAPPHKSARTGPKITAPFSKAAVKYLSTIGRNADRSLVDAASVDFDSATSTYADKSVAGQIDIFAAVYSAKEKARQAMDEASGSVSPNEGSACIGAWVPLLRALSTETPKVCKTFMAQ
jgi:hypothetical protein